MSSVSVSPQAGKRTRFYRQAESAVARILDTSEILASKEVCDAVA